MEKLCDKIEEEVRNRVVDELAEQHARTSGPVVDNIVDWHLTRIAERLAKEEFGERS